MIRTAIIRNVFFILLGATAFLLRRHYSGPFVEAVYSWGGNVSVSFALCFVVGISIIGRRFGRLATAGIALLPVEVFEVTNGFGVMSNVYDPFDFVANAVGVGLAFAIDTVASWIDAHRLNRREQTASGTSR